MSTLAENTVALVADVAVRAALTDRRRDAIFSYRVPDHLRDLITIGHLAWVPLRQQPVQGVVLALSRRPASGLRDLIDLVDPEVSIPPLGIALARWVATTYYAPLITALDLCLPPGIAGQAEPTWRATVTGLSCELGALPERERGILFYLRRHGEQGESELQAALRGSAAGLRAACRALAERGLVARGLRIEPPRVRPRREQVVELTVSDLAQALEQLRRAPRQAAALRWLAERQELAAPTMTELRRMTGLDLAGARALAQRGFIAVSDREVYRDPLAMFTQQPDVPPPLTAAQREVYETIVTALEAGTGGRFLIHGITGSGKTEVYLRLIARALRLGKQALVLAPEIALTAQLVRRFAARFGNQLAVLHSGLSDGERYDTWRRLRRGEARLLIGARSALFAPLQDLGLVIVDEEHEPGYKSDTVPRYHARDAALQLSELAGVTVVLGSATPSVESFYAARAGRLQLLQLPERIGGLPGADGLIHSRPLPLPPIRIVDMRHELQQGNTSIFSAALQQALIQTLDRGQQALLFLNRRGAASFVLCRDCGYVARCDRCALPLTVHYDSKATAETGSQVEVLVCHSCGLRVATPVICPQCLSRRIRALGAGTQRVVEAVRELCPDARVARWDRDSATGKDAHGALLEAMLTRQIDVVVGTQMIAKGLDLPLVTLVGVILADTGLHLPDFRSGERTFQLLTQVAGRAGRRSEGGQVIIQTYQPDHYALQAAREHDFRAFFREEIAFRRALSYPPFGRLVRFVIGAASEDTCRRQAERLVAALQSFIRARDLAGWRLIGPAPAFFRRQRDRWRWHLLLRVPADTTTQALTAALDAVGPLRGWVVDIDPVHVL
ncbi:replication restart helicase PriA [Chloroflexus sp.]|uniref:replication restart helicase PriA n=1 Tax=Chloroflexus sp. TaxID=1904827 RepID=UPI00262F3E5B|nr:primosomal protein N' [uncultured Chloroflexus sp.]